MPDCKLLLTAVCMLGCTCMHVYHQAVRGVFGADHNKAEPAASPWVKVLERPGDDNNKRSESVQIENPYKNPDAKDVSDDVPEKVCLQYKQTLPVAQQDGSTMQAAVPDMQLDVMLWVYSSDLHYNIPS